MPTSQSKPQADRPARASVPQGTAPAAWDAADADWLNGSPLRHPPPVPGTSLKAYWYAFQRHWLLATALGLLSALVAASLVVLAPTPKYTAVSLLRIAPNEEALVFDSAAPSSRGSFDVYKRTQQQLLQSRFLLASALENEEVRKLSVIREQVEPAAWLARKLSVSFPGDAEIMQVSLTCDDPESAAIIVAAVVDTYMKEIVEVERNRQRERLDDLDRVFKEKEAEIRAKRAELEKLTNEAGTGNSATLALKQQIALQRLAEYRKELTRQQFRLCEARRDLESRRRALAATEQLFYDEYDLDAAVRTDPWLRPLIGEYRQRQNRLVAKMAAATPQAAEHFCARERRDLEVLGQQIARRLDDLRTKRRAAIESNVRVLEDKIAVLAGEHRQLQSEVERQKAQAEQVGDSSIDIEMKREEIHQLDDVLRRVAAEREELRVEIGYSSRITLVQPAEVPKAPDQIARVSRVAGVSLAGFFLPVCGIVVWESRKQRIYTTEEVARTLGIHVLGSVPVIPSQALRRGDSWARRHRTWRARLTEAIDNIAASLIRKAQTEQSRLLLVTSAMSREGKTTLSGQIAQSLARTGYRAVLVDFDMRRPAQHRAYRFPLEPGVAEVLRHQVDVLGIVNETEIENLWLAPAGRWDRFSHSALARGGAAAILEELRALFEFVIVDGSPILPVADCRYIAQHVDEVVLAIRCDVSQAPRVLAAREALASLGVEHPSAVVAGTPREPYYKYKELNYYAKLVT